MGNLHYTYCKTDVDDIYIYGLDSIYRNVIGLGLGLGLGLLTCALNLNCHKQVQLHLQKWTVFTLAVLLHHLRKCLHTVCTYLTLSIMGETESLSMPTRDA